MNESQRQKKTFVHMQAFELSLSKRQSGAKSRVGAAAAERQTPAAQVRQEAPWQCLGPDPRPPVTHCWLQVRV